MQKLNKIIADLRVLKEQILQDISYNKEKGNTYAVQIQQEQFQKVTQALMVLDR
ncbi:hypothetical protein ACTNDN_23125 [Niallia sp. HCP3S3_B10]|uniref:hypothetical protein n=1 Tax=Niallia sp. HCP3S3_B10 TaxID=3438944 RepID=UPI003F8CCCD2